MASRNQIIKDQKSIFDLNNTIVDYQIALLKSEPTLSIDMNSLITAFKLSFKLVNPYAIKPQFQLLSQDSTQTSIKLIQKSQINYDSYIMRFSLPEQSKCLGLKIGQFVELHINSDKKNYVPISRIDEPGFVDFLIRDMSEKVGSEKSFSRKLVEMKEGQNVTLKGPKTSYLYHGYGHVQTAEFNKKFKRIGIVAYQTGITATYSLIESIFTNQDNETGVSLLWLGNKMEDFVFIDELGFLVEQSKLFMNVMLNQPEKGFPGLFGQVEEKHFRDYLPPADQDTVLFLAGTTQQVVNLKEIATKMEYKYIVI